MADGAGDEDVTRWQATPFMRVMAASLSVVMLGSSLAFAVAAAFADGTDIVLGLLVAAMVAGFGVGMFRIGVWPALIASRDAHGHRCASRHG